MIYVATKDLQVYGIPRCADYAALAVDVWVFMVLPTVFALTKSILPISQGELHHHALYWYTHPL